MLEERLLQSFVWKMSAAKL